MVSVQQNIDLDKLNALKRFILNNDSDENGCDSETESETEATSFEEFPHQFEISNSSNDSDTSLLDLSETDIRHEPIQWPWKDVPVIYDDSYSCHNMEPASEEDTGLLAEDSTLNFTTLDVPSLDTLENKSCDKTEKITKITNRKETETRNADGNSSDNPKDCALRERKQKLYCKYSGRRRWRRRGKRDQSTIDIVTLSSDSESDTTSSSILGSSSDDDEGKSEKQAMWVSESCRAHWRFLYHDHNYFLQPLADDRLREILEPRIEESMITREDETSIDAKIQVEVCNEREKRKNKVKMRWTRKKMKASRSACEDDVVAQRKSGKGRKNTLRTKGRKKRLSLSGSSDEIARRCEFHNQLERVRRAEMRQLFKNLQKTIWGNCSLKDNKESKVRILNDSVKLINALELESDLMMKIINEERKRHSYLLKRYYKLKKVV